MSEHFSVLTRNSSPLSGDSFEIPEVEPNAVTDSESIRSWKFKGDGNIASGRYADKCEELLSLNKDLHSMGAAMLVDLPRIAVIGGQSAGKSSLVEAVSGINVPRDAGTCTRCPTECTMSNAAASWSCTISLRLDYDTTGEPLLESKRIAFSAPITEKSDVEIWLRRAQAAILAPHLPDRWFINKTKDELNDLRTTDPYMLKFSKNIIAVDINDPDATNLSFVDLPGLIQNEDPGMIDLVRDLATHYIQGDKTLILITIPMSDDMENQQAVRLAREVDPEGKRTIGVLTKPDTILPGSFTAQQKWRSVLDGTSYPLRNGYYCVLLPDDEAREKNLPRAELQTHAAKFFKTTAPWNTLANSSRLGIPAFVSDISELLVVLIEKTLPALKLEVGRLLTGCQRDLAWLPPPPTGDPMNELIARVTAFCKDTQGLVDGNGPNKALVQKNRARYSRLKKDIRDTAPDFRPFEDPWQYRKPPFETSDEDPTTIHPIGLLDVKAVIRRSITWELPHTIPFEAKKFLIDGFTSRWTEPSQACFKDIFATLAIMLGTLVKIHFDQFAKLENEVTSMMQKYFHECNESAHAALLNMLALERTPLFTQNIQSLEAERTKWRNHYTNVVGYPSQYACSSIPRPAPVIEPLPPVSSKKGKGKKVRVTTPQPDPFAFEFDSMSDNEAPATPVALNTSSFTGSSLRYHDEATDDTKASSYEDELIVMAEVRAYFQIAYTRVVDYIPLCIEHNLNQAMATKVNMLLSKLLTDSAFDAKDLLSEDLIVARQREALHARRKRLMEIKMKLDAFMINV